VSFIFCPPLFFGWFAQIGAFFVYKYYYITFFTICQWKKSKFVFFCATFKRKRHFADLFLKKALGLPFFGNDDARKHA